MGCFSGPTVSCSLFLLYPWMLGNSVDVRYALGRKELTDYNKIIHRNTEIFSNPREIVFFLIVSARKHKNQLPQCWSTAVTQQLRSSSLYRIVLRHMVWKVPWAVTANSWTVLVWCQLIIQISGFLHFCSVPEKAITCPDSVYPEICLTQVQRFGKNKSLAEYVHGENGWN